MGSPGKIQADRELSLQADQARGVHPRPPLRCTLSVRLAAYSNERQTPYMPVVLIEHLAFRCQSLDVYNHGIRTICYALDLTPLGRIRDRHAHHRLIPLQPVEGDSQVVAA